MLVTANEHDVFVSITKFLIVTGLSRNRRMIKWVSNYRYPIWTVCHWIPVIGYPCGLHVNYVHFSGFLCYVSSVFKTYSKCYWRFCLKEVLQREFWNFVINTINSWLDLVLHNSGSNHSRNLKSALHFVFIQFWNYSCDYPLNCAPLSPITVTNLYSWVVH